MEIVYIFMPFVKGKCKLLSLFFQKDSLNVEKWVTEQIAGYAWG